MSDKNLPDVITAEQFARFLRQRVDGHSPGYDITIYGRPATWLALADLLDPPSGKQDPQYGLRSGHNASGLSNMCDQDEGA